MAVLVRMLPRPPSRRYFSGRYPTIATAMFSALDGVAPQSFAPLSQTGWKADTISGLDQCCRNMGLPSSTETSQRHAKFCVVMYAVTAYVVVCRKKIGKEVTSDMQNFPTNRQTATPASASLVISTKFGQFRQCCIVLTPTDNGICILQISNKHPTALFEFFPSGVKIQCRLPTIPFPV